MNTAAIDASQVAAQYIAMWNETDPGRRDDLLASHWASDASYVDPMMSAAGPVQISAMVGGLHQRYPGFRFQLKGQPDAHAGNLRFSWTLGPAAAPDMIEGTDFAQLDGGRLKFVVGFLDKVPVGA